MHYKIAFLLPNFESQGGVTVSVRTIANYLKKLGHEIHLFPVGETDTTKTTFIHPINTKRRSIQLSLIKEIFFAEEKKKPFDLVVSNTKQTNTIVSKLNISHKHLIILHQSSMMKKKYFLTRIKQRFFYPNIYDLRYIATTSNCLLEKFLMTFPYLKPKDIRVIYNSFSPTFLQSKSNELTLLPTFDYIINVGRLSKGKNHLMLLKAFKDLKNKDIHLIILGEGNQENNLKKIVKKYNLNKRVHFLGWKQNPYPYIKNAKLLVHTSKYETFGLVLLEALALNTPVVATDISCGPTEILTNNLSKFLVPINDVNQLVKITELALAKYPKIDSCLLEKFQDLMLELWFRVFVRDANSRYINIITSLKEG